MKLTIQRVLWPLFLVGGVLAQETSNSRSMSDSVQSTPTKKPAAETANATQGEKPAAPPEPNNEIFFHPVLTVITLATDLLPLIVAVTLEHHLADGKSFIWQPQLVAGSSKDSTTKISQYAFGSYFGLRSYFNGELHRGFYIQGSVAAELGEFKAEHIGYADKASAFVQVYGALGYLGYRWKHVFWDLGGGYQTVSGTLKFNSGEEVKVSASGLALDMNLGFTF